MSFREINTALRTTGDSNGSIVSLTIESVMISGSLASSCSVIIQ